MRTPLLAIAGQNLPNVTTVLIPLPLPFPPVMSTALQSASFSESASTSVDRGSIRLNADDVLEERKGVGFSAVEHVREFDKRSETRRASTIIPKGHVKPKKGAMKANARYNPNADGRAAKMKGIKSMLGGGSRR